MNDVTGRMSYYTQRTFPLREHDSTVEQGERYKEANSQTQAQQVQRDSGVRWSQLLRIPYFDCIRQQCLDPMHLIFSGRYIVYILQCENVPLYALF